MATQFTKEHSIPWVFPNGVSSTRRYRRYQKGWTGGDHLTPYTYTMQWAYGRGYNYNVVSKQYNAIDVGNTRSYLALASTSGIPSWAQANYNQAYARFRDEAVGEASQLGTFFAEWREGLGMVTNRTLGLVDAARKLRKGDFPGFVKALSVSPKKKHRNKTHAAAHEFSGLWLEYHFGWSPSVADIFSAVDVMQRAWPAEKARGSAKVHYSREDGKATGYIRTQTGTIQHVVGAELRMTNPNLFLANQLGLLNPVSIAWELVPFSFVADWFFDIGSFLESFSDFAGVQVIRPWSLAFMRYTDVDAPNPDHFTNVQWFDGPCTIRGSALMRMTGIPRPIPNRNISANLGNSITRAASAVSLLTQLLTGKR